MAKKGGKAKNDDSDEWLEKMAYATVAVIIVAVLLWVWVLEPVVIWAKANPFAATGIGVLIALLLGAAGYAVLRYQFGWFQPNSVAAAGSPSGRGGQTKSAGVSPSGRAASTAAAAPAQPRTAEPEEGTLLTRVIAEIEAYTPPRRFPTEDLYQMGLHGRLEAKFGNARVEQSSASGRPDIVIGPIAVEVKGPTNTGALNTLSQKAWDYLQEYEHVVFALFHIEAPKATVDKKLGWVDRHGGRVHVIRK